MKIKIVAVILIIVVMFLYGRQPKQIVDDIEMPNVVGYDYIDKNTIRTTTVLPVYKPDKSIENKALSVEGELSKETLGRFQRKSFQQLGNGKLAVAVYSKKLARRGIGSLIDSFHRDPKISEKLYLTVVDGQAKTLLSKQYGEGDNGLFLSELIEQNIESGVIPKTNLHYFLSAYFSKINDPFLPFIQKKGDEVIVKGIALFKGDRYVGTLGQNKLFVFKALIENITLGTYKVRINNRENAIIQSINIKHKYNIQNIKERPNIDIFLNGIGTIIEFKGRKLNQEEITKIEKQMNEQLERQATTLIRSFQKLKIDPIGLGDEVRSRTRNFNDQKWLKQYPNVKVNIKVHMVISEKGVSDGE
ncbi:Ger(x)C family spore germination protein [Neobacillus cucumis]|uniref:Ger(x)C family spore germination protein n=1 Tax=Neobacillus cucumis TaxID=1740721 RepID=UPI002E1D73F7|nr:Ger(x)C family spore germination protein [Neobacillus cucumis]